MLSFAVRTGCLLLVALLLTLESPESRGQSIATGERSGHARSWPQPVRQANHVESTGAHSLTPIPSNALRLTTMASPHRLLHPPTMPGASLKHPPKHPKFHQPHYWSQHHRPIQPEPAVVPDANGRSTWKTPYSYGYFGASGSRHWSLHFGYRDRYTEWRLR